MAGMPYDGRDRRAPEWTGGMKPDQFQDALVRTVIDTTFATMQPPVIPAEYSPAQARRYHAVWLQHFSFFAWRFPSWLMEIASRCPYQDVRRGVIEDCVDEEVGDLDADGRCHIDVLYEEAEACGLTRDEIAATEPPPIIQTCILALDNLARSFPWEVSFAAIGSLEIISAKPAVEYRNSVLGPELNAAMDEAMSASLPERLGIPAENMLFAALHSYKDQFHGGGELALLVKYATDARIQNEMLWAARMSLQAFGMMVGEVRRLAIVAVEG
jgi:pyrroloquinoline quinone (PQQ) biosynthesis protein C